MLSIPPKLKAAFDSGQFQPLTHVDIRTQTLDQISSVAPVMLAIQGSLDIPTEKRNITMSYPDNSSSSVQILNTSPPNARGKTFGNIFGASFVYFCFQTFTLGEDNQQANQLKLIETRINIRDSTGEAAPLSPGQWLLKCRIYDAVNGIPTPDLQHERRLLANSIGRFFVNWSEFETLNIINPGPFTESTTVIDPFNLSVSTGLVPWIFDDTLVPGHQYAVVLILEEEVQTGTNFLELFGIYWDGDFIDQEGEVSGPTTSNRRLDMQLHFSEYVATPTPILQIQFDLNGTPIDAGNWEMIDDQVTVLDVVTNQFQETAITYNAWAGDTQGAKTINLGAVSSGDAIPVTALKRYYTLEATFSATANGLRTPNFVSARPIFPGVFGGESKIFEFASSRIELDGKEIPSAIRKTPSISTKMDIRSSITRRGSIKIELLDIGGEIARMATEENLLNLPVAVRFGHLPTAQKKSDLVLLFNGVVKDFTYQQGQLTLVIENRSINLKKKVPIIRGGAFSAFEDTVIRRDFRGMTFVQSILRIIQESGIRSEYIDDLSFSTVDAYLKGTDTNNLYITNRVIVEQFEALDESNQLLKLISSSLVEREDGKISLIQYPVTSTAIGTWDESVVAADEIQPESISRSITNLCLVHYDSVNGEPQSVVAFGDLDAMQAWAPGSDDFVADYTIKTKWIGPEVPYNGKTIAARIGERLVKILKNGIVEVKFKTSIDRYEAQVGDKINLVTPTFLKKGQFGAKKSSLTAFVLIEKKADIDKGLIRWVAVEDIQIQRPPTANFTATPLSGVPDLVINVDASLSVDPDGTITLYEWDFDYDGNNFTQDATGITAAHTYTATAIGIKTISLRVTDNNGAKHQTEKLSNGDDAKITVQGAPIARISSMVSAPDQPLQIFLTSLSVGTTAPIILTEWDLSYDGTTFNSEVLGEETFVNLPYKTIRVALKVTDDFGLTAQVDVTFTGKTLTPAAPTGFFVDQTGENIVFNWDINPEIDLFAYEIREGATWDSSVLISGEILSNSFMTIGPSTEGTYTYLIKSINTSGFYSIAATSIIMSIIDPRNRNVIAKSDIKALGWSGTKTGLVYDVQGDRWWIESASGNVTQGDTTQTAGDSRATVLSGTRVSGTFETNTIDLGSKIDGIRLSIDIGTDIIPDPIGTSIVKEYSESDDNVTFTQFTQLSQGDLGYRYVKSRITLKNDDNASNLAIKDFAINNDVPDVFDSQEDLVVSVGGTTFTFLRAFNVTASIPRPSVNITIQNATIPLWYELTSVTNAGFTIKIKRVSDSVDVGGTIDYLAKGF